MMTLEDGLIKTCLLPVFSALLMALRASASTEVLVMLSVVKKRFREICNDFFSWLHRERGGVHPYTTLYRGNSTPHEHGAKRTHSANRITLAIVFKGEDLSPSFKSSKSLVYTDLSCSEASHQNGGPCTILKKSSHTVVKRVRAGDSWCKKL
ncbi:hypothetical protein METSCH_D03510 [Metschnikowia aff. pulcherrima]|uniref:Uncharacterized protein n=1 Tax=Metschnikowia aff. pulcherrima TaxID=2163413 RepID=A0A4P6XTS4_9ASCO|nr:hypothetical protein METSCH_D03510 [Metschnikowia aff. pulcherrima]